jgi:membrane fusion protein (multidrug efflux system)
LGARAALLAAEADYARAGAAYDQASGAEIAFARANVQSRQAAADRARADLERMKPLVAKQEISRLQFDAYVAASRVADSELQAARERLESQTKSADSLRAAAHAAEARIAQARAAVEQSQAGQQQVTVVRAQASAAAAGVAQAQANLEAAALQLSYTTITAPEDGVVTKKAVEPGQVVQPGQSLLTVVPLHKVWVTANFKETQLGDVRPGFRAEVKVDMYGRRFAGRVDSISSATGTRMSLLPPENATGNYIKVVQRIPVKIVLDNLPEDAVLRPGMNAEATIFLK